MVVRDRLAAGQVVLSTCPSMSIPSHSAHSSAGRDYGPGQLECEGGVGHERRGGHKGLSTSPSASAMADRVTPGGVIRGPWMSDWMSALLLGSKFSREGLSPGEGFSIGF